MSTPRRPLTLRKCNWMDDWYVIEWAEHDGRSWFEPIRDEDGAVYGQAFQCSSRMSDADVEGPGAEMRALATAILAGEAASFKRCAVDIHGDEASFESPRNSTRPGIVHIEDARDLARHILATVSG